MTQTGRIIGAKVNVLAGLGEGLPVLSVFNATCISDCPGKKKDEWRR